MTGNHELSGWREWMTLSGLTDRLPQEFQRGFSKFDLQLTCIDGFTDHLVLGTNAGLVYLAHLPTYNLIRLKCENQTVPISCVRSVSTVDDMIAAGCCDGTVSIFQMPRIPPQMTESFNAQSQSVSGVYRNITENVSMQPSVRRFTITHIHRARVTSLCWSTNGMRLFVGDSRGVISQAEIDFQTSECYAREIAREDCGILQLSFARQLLAISTAQRCVLLRTQDGASGQVGSEQREYPGLFGCAWLSTDLHSKLYAARTGLKLWLANEKAEVTQRFVIDELSSEMEIRLMNPFCEKPREGERFGFGLLNCLGSDHLVSYNSHWLFVLDTSSDGTLKLCGFTGRFRHITGVAVIDYDLYVLEGSRVLSCLSLDYPTCGRKVPAANQQTSSISEAQQLRELGSRLLTQGSGFLGHLARFGGTIAARVSDSMASPNAGSVLQESGNKQGRVIAGDAVILSPPSIVRTSQDGESTSNGHPNLPFIRRASSGYSPIALSFTSNANLVQSLGELIPSFRQTKTPAADTLCGPYQGEPEKFEHSVSSGQIIASGEDFLPLVIREKVRKKQKHRPGATASPDSLSCNNDGNVSAQTSISTSPVSSYTDDSSMEKLRMEMEANQDDGISKSSLECGTNVEYDMMDDGLNERKQVKVMAENNGCNATEKNNHVGSPLPLVIDNRTYEDLRLGIQERENLLADMLGLECLRMDHEESSIVETDNTNDGNNCDINNSNYASVNTAASFQRESSVESELSSLTSTIKELSSAPDHINNDEFSSGDFYSRFQRRTLSSLDSIDDPPDGVGTIDGGNGFYAENESLEQYPSNSSEDRLSSLSYGPPSGSSVTSCRRQLPDASFGVPGASLWLPDAAVNSGTEIELESETLLSGWTKWIVPGNFCCFASDISSCSFIDTSGNLFVPQTQGTYRVSRLRMTPEQVCVAKSVTWLVSDGNLYHTDSMVGDFSSSPNVPDVASVSVDEKEQTWFVNTDGSVGVCHVKNGSNTATTSAVLCQETRLKSIMCRAGVVWGLTPEGLIVYRIGITEHAPTGHSWGILEGIPYIVVGMTLGTGSLGWAMDCRGHLYFRPGVTSDHPRGEDDHWWEVSLSSFLFNSVKGNNIFIEVVNGNVYIGESGTGFFICHEAPLMGHSWRLFADEKWATISAESLFGEHHGVLCCLSPKDHLDLIMPDTGVVLPLEFPSTECIIGISQRPEALWVLTVSGDVHIREGLSAVSRLGSYWAMLDLHQIGDVHLCHISLGMEVVWAVDAQGGVYMRQGPLSCPSPESLPPAWIQVDGSKQKKGVVFTKVFVGTKCHIVWGIDSCRRIYVREGIFPELPIGLSWLPVPGLLALNISISETEVFVLSPNGEVYKRIGVSITNYIGDAWQRVPGSLAKLSVSTDGCLWGLGNSGQIMRHHQALTTNWPAPFPTEQFDNAFSDWEVV